MSTSIFIFSSYGLTVEHIPFVGAAFNSLGILFKSPLNFRRPNVVVALSALVFVVLWIDVVLFTVVLRECFNRLFGF